MKQLWEVKKEYFEILEHFVENEGELTDELAEAIAINRNDAEDTIDNQIAVISLLENQNDLIAIQVARLELISDRQQQFIKKLKQNIVDAVKLYGVNSKMTISGFKLSVKLSKSISILDTDRIPDKYVNYVLTKKVSTDEFKKLNYQGEFTTTIDKRAMLLDDEPVGFEIIEKESLVRR